MWIWLELLFCLSIIGYAGYLLSRYGDIIAEKKRRVRFLDKPQYLDTV